MIRKIEIIRDDDPRCLELEASGYTLVGESWGARLLMVEGDGLDIYTKAVNLALENGIELQELGIEFADALLELELVTNPDYPYTPATFHAIPTQESIRELWKVENKIFGAFVDGRLVGAISTSRTEQTAELDFASVLSEYRGKGLGKALAAAAILKWVAQGVEIFATGGASVNEV